MHLGFISTANNPLFRLYNKYAYTLYLIACLAVMYYSDSPKRTHLMMAAKDVKMATDNLSCPVCYQLFKKPKYLPCHHSYCEQCLENMQVQSKIICPECRKEAIVPPGGVKDLDNNFFINRLVDEFILKRKVEGEEEVKCEECSGEDPVVAFCPDCTLFLCHVCNEYHKRSNKFRGHGIVPLAEFKSNKGISIQPKPKAMMCREHDMEMLFYCETCDQLVRVYCTVKDHKDHSHDTVKKMIDNRRQELKKIIAPVEEMIRGLSVTHDNIEKMRKNIRQQSDQVNVKIDQHYDGVVQKLMEQKEELRQQVHDLVSQKEKAITTLLEEVECAQAEVLSMKELNDAMERSSDPEVLSVKKQVIDRMRQITDKYKKVNHPTVQQAIFEFVPTKEAVPQLGFLHSVNSHISEVISLPKLIIKGKETKVIIVTKHDNGDRCFRGGSQVSVQLGGVNDTAQVRDGNDGSYVASFVPQQVGEVKLSVFVNGQQIKGSPYSVMVKDSTSINKPTKIMNNDGNMGEPWGIAFAKNGMWAVADCSNHCVFIFDCKDQLVRKFGGNGSCNGQFCCSAGITFDSDDCLYVADHANHRVQKFTIRGKYLCQFGGEGSSNGKLKYPGGLASHDHKVYVADSHNERISVFQTDGKFHHTIGSGQLGSPCDVTVDSNNQLLVADCGHHCIHTFTLDGDHVGKFGTYGTGTGRLYSPYGVAVDLYGFILVADTGNNRVSIFNKDGNFVQCFGSWGSAIGQFQCPYGIAVSANGNIYVSDRNIKRIQVFFC